MTSLPVMRRAVPLLSLLVALPALAQLPSDARAEGAPPGCTEKDKGFWQSLRARKGVPAEGASVDSLAPALVQCLGSPDPEVRDGLAYGLLATWLGSDALSEPALHATTRMLLDGLVSGLGETGSDSVLRRSFSALVLSEVVHRDNARPFLTPEEASKVLATAVRYMEEERDLRGFSDEVGWMHGAAHGADLLWQLAMSPRLKRADLERILSAVGAKVAPAEHAYVHSEGDRLARVVGAVMHRGQVPPDAFARWLEGLTAFKRGPTWVELRRTEKGLVRAHNLKHFVQALHARWALAKAEPATRRLLPYVVSELEKVSLG